MIPTTSAGVRRPSLPGRALQPLACFRGSGRTSAGAFETARQSLNPREGIPDPVARQRVLEVMHWLLEDGIVLGSSPVSPARRSRFVH